MFKFKCFVFCVVVVCLRNAYVTEADDEGVEGFEILINDCKKEFGITIAELDSITRGGDLSVINPCYWGCYFKKIGLLTDEGEYDLNAGLATYRKYIKNNQELARMEATAKQCESVKDVAVKDGAAGCDRGFLLASCFLEKTLAYRQKETS